MDQQNSLIIIQQSTIKKKVTCLFKGKANVLLDYCSKQHREVVFALRGQVHLNLHRISIED